MLHWTPEFETPGNSGYTLWAGDQPMYLLSLSNEGKWGIFYIQGVEGAVQISHWETLQKAKTVAILLTEAQAA